MPKYIDADSLKVVMVFGPKLGDLTVPEMRDILAEIDSVPAADVEPKREIVPWKVAGPFDDSHQCTKCGNMWPIFSTVEWAYCPVCGCRKFLGQPKSWTDNPWCNAVDKAMETEPPKGEDNEIK